MDALKADATYGEYLALEESEGVKYEWVAGSIYGMAGGTIEHGALAAALTGLLVAQLRGRPCRVLSSDVKVRIEATDRTTYPDLSVVCGELERSDRDANAVTNPVLLAEVLSDSTEADDRGEKFAHYRRLPSLRDYLLVSQAKPRVELFSRGEAGTWTFRVAEQGGLLDLPSIGVQLSVDELYRDPLG